MGEAVAAAQIIGGLWDIAVVIAVVAWGYMVVTRLTDIRKSVEASHNALAKHIGQTTEPNEVDTGQRIKNLREEMAKPLKPITIGDISTLIDYLFITGPSLGLAECL